MTTVSNSLVEAAARAINPVAREAEFAYPLSDENFARYVHLAAEAALEAVGDALRLEGAQAENARIKTDIERSPSYTQRLGQWVSIHDIWNVLEK